MGFKKETDLNTCKETAKTMCEAVPIKPVYGMFVSHPFVNNIFTMIKIDGELKTINLIDSEDYKKWKQSLDKEIDSAKDIISVYLMINIPYRLVMIKYWKDNLSRKDFSMLLSDAWVVSENPNKDINVSVNELKRWFKQADKQVLMDKDEFKKLESLPDEFDIYRGIGDESNPKGLSWTRDLDTAKWFRDRFKSKNPYILRAKIKKQYCLAYFIGRNEDEIVIDYNKITDKEILK